ncbi:hypothetical protein KCP70_09425 [Salmonella enterica subsp. enterica]|nr:hypothetical protein KCP70_09425 [Salmonella enterica subsp. enterica]
MLRALTYISRYVPGPARCREQPDRATPTVDLIAFAFVGPKKATPHPAKESNIQSPHACYGVDNHLQKDRSRPIHCAFADSAKHHRYHLPPFESKDTGMSRYFSVASR